MSNYTVSGAGATAANDTYSPTTANSSGNDCWQSAGGVWYIVKGDGDFWFIGTNKDALYYDDSNIAYRAEDAGSTPPLTGWVVDDTSGALGVNPAPTIAAVVVAKKVKAAKQFPTGGQVPVKRLRWTVKAAHAPVCTLTHAASHPTGGTSLGAAPTPTQDNATSPPSWHFNLLLGAAVTDAFFNLAAESAASTSDAVTVTDFRLYDTAGNELLGTPDTTAPATPTGLHGTAPSGECDLVWNANGEGDLAGYKLYRDGALVHTGTGTTFNDTGRTNGTAYSYRVSAYDAAGNESPQSAPVSLTPNVAPTAISVSVVSPTTGASGQGVVSVRAQADNGVGGVARVDLSVNGVVVDSLFAPTTTPDFYDLTWDSSPSGNGEYTLTVTAYDHATPTPNTATDSVTFTADNPDRLSTAYFYSTAQTPAAGKTLKRGLVTCDLVPAADARAKRLVTAGYRLGATTGDFDAHYTTVPLDTQVLFGDGAGDTFSVGFKLSALYAVGSFSLTGQVVKLIALDDASLLVWTDDNKLYTFDGASTPTLLLDAATLLQSGETLNDVAVWNGRVCLALAGGTAPASRLYQYDPAAGEESYAVYGFAAALTALAVKDSLFLGTVDGKVHRLGTDGSLKLVVGATTPLPHAVTGLRPLALAPSHTDPGVAILTAGGYVYDIDAGNATYGATLLFSPPDGGVTAANDAALVGTTKYLATGTNGDLFALTPPATGYTLAFTAGGAINAVAAFGGTLYFGLAGDGRLWGKALDPAAHTLAFGPVTDALDGVTDVTSLLALNGDLFLGTRGTGNNLWRYEAPAVDANSVYAQAITHPGAMVTEFV